MARWPLRRQPLVKKLDKEMSRYLPLFGIWLIDLTIICGWHRPTSPRRWPEIFDDADFCLMTGMESVNSTSATDDEEDNDEEPIGTITVSRCRKLLHRHRALLIRKKLCSQLPMFKNINFLAELLDLNDADKAALTFAAGLKVFPQLDGAISPRGEKVSTTSFCKILARITGLPEQDLLSALSPDGPLVTTGLVKVNRSVCYLEEKIACINGLEDILLLDHRDSAEVMECFLRPVDEPSLTLADFPHLRRDSNLLAGYLSSALDAKTQGVNILIHGRPGVGKNQYVQALAAELKVKLYEVSYSDNDGNPVKGESRLRAYALCQRFLARAPGSMLLFDEVEDVFQGGHNFFSMLMGDEERSDGNGKAWINRTLEGNPIPSIWISNRVNQIDKAYLRRFDYSVHFPTPPLGVRVSMAKYHLDQFNPPDSWIEQLASNDEITPGQFQKAAKVGLIGSKGDNKLALNLVENVLLRSTSLLGQRRTPNRNILRTGYSLEWLNTDVPVASLAEGARLRPRGTFCFYGAAGTGKSELARYLADQAGRPLLVQRASDILSPYVGVAEQNIAEMFDRARQQDAVLVLDEADSFLADRRGAHRSWEVTQVNELLTQMEAFDGIFICTTNLMEKLDPASLRRFAFKVRFDPLTPDQRWSMFQWELLRLAGSGDEACGFEQKVRCLEALTPGDFAVAARQFDILGIAVTADDLYCTLLKECEAKRGRMHRIGFETTG
ncbi:ATPase, AAA family [Citrifermentans bremense]|uniref:ATPase, AAA family n=1 Tax=Citrifermentans bremense TaxID=60035 RepID=A0A6S6M3K0_9BACT|nr:AAA family ATPase [Citrifermentans bremense]BCG47969.1 ATPase, AAA family [Citrifermentans bremense]